MTENEAKRPKIAIVGGGRNAGRTLKAHIDLLEELEQYRAIGTVEEIQKKMEELDRWHADRINENIKNPFAYTSTSICHNCDHKDEYIEELEAENAEYQSIGTIEDFKALKEKKSEWKYSRKENIATCKNCSYEHYLGTYHQYATNYCPKCGSKMKET